MMAARSESRHERRCVHRTACSLAANDRHAGRRPCVASARLPGTGPGGDDHPCPAEGPRRTAEGLGGVHGAHTVEGLADETIRGLLADQETAYTMLFDDTAGSRPLSQHHLKSWHQLITRHQATVTGLAPDGQRVHAPFCHKGVWKASPNNPKRSDGVTHEYCPPERERYPTEVEAAWMHHRFVRTHPFQDGNGRVSRMVMAYAYLRRGEPPPLITAAGRVDYIGALERADRGDLRAFSDHLGRLASVTLAAAVDIGRDALEGRLSRPCGNGGRILGTRYKPPGE